jgi:hypothetical protein
VYRRRYLLAPRSQQQQALHQKHYNAKFTDFIWHTDLHELYAEPDGMGGRSIIDLIAFMDDTTRFITGWKMLFDKKQKQQQWFYEGFSNQQDKSRKGNNKEAKGTAEIRETTIEAANQMLVPSTESSDSIWKRP